MKKNVVLFLLVATSVHAKALANESQSIDMSFEKCLVTKQSTIASLNVKPSDIKEIVNTSILTITKVCTVDGGVLISCSKPDNKMVITRSGSGGCQ